MFVVVGSFMEYVFVLDTSDGSCEMLRYEELKKSGVDYTVQERVIDSLAKFRMLYGIISGGIIIPMKLPYGMTIE